MKRIEVLTSKVEAERVLRRVGLSAVVIEDTLRPCPDPLDLEEALLRRGLTLEMLTDRLGGSS